MPAEKFASAPAPTFSTGTSAEKFASAPAPPFSGVSRTFPPALSPVVSSLPLGRLACLETAGTTSPTPAEKFASAPAPCFSAGLTGSLGTLAPEAGSWPSSSCWAVSLSPRGSALPLGRFPFLGTTGPPPPCWVVSSAVPGLAGTGAGTALPTWVAVPCAVPAVALVPPVPALPWVAVPKRNCGTRCEGESANVAAGRGASPVRVAQGRELRRASGTMGRARGNWPCDPRGRGHSSLTR